MPLQSTVDTDQCHMYWRANPVLYMYMYKGIKNNSLTFQCNMLTTGMYIHVIYKVYHYYNHMDAVV